MAGETPCQDDHGSVQRGDGIYAVIDCTKAGGVAQTKEGVLCEPVLRPFMSVQSHYAHCSVS